MSRLVPYRNSSRSTDFSASNKVSTTMPAAAALEETATLPRDRIEAISKYVPAEILAFYIPVVPAINLMQHKDWQIVMQWGVFLFAWLLVPAYFLWIGEGDKRRGQQVIVSSVAFPIWAYVTNRTIGPLANWYDDALGLVLLLAFTVISGFLLPKR